MAKYWTSGRVKTRLGENVGLERAAAIHRMFVLHLADNLETAAEKRVMVVDPEPKIDLFREAIGDNWTFTPQSNGDLGQRMSRWFSSGLATSSHAILIGADCPLIAAEDIQQAVCLLAEHDVVLGPALDGGYYLIGLRGSWKPEFVQLWDGISWSTSDVYENTLSRIRQLGLSLGTLPQREDIDTIAELTRLRQTLETTRSQNPSHEALAVGLDNILNSE